MKRAERASSEPLGFIDERADVQSEASAFPVTAGVSNLRVLYTVNELSTPVDISVVTSTGFHRGVHMSRLVKAASASKGRTMEEWLKFIAKQVNRTQPGSVVTCSYELPYEDRFVSVVMRATERGAVSYRFVVDGLTACPCSKKMIGIGHMQRARITMVLKAGGPVDALQVVRGVTECFSAAPREDLRRREEARKILEAQANPQFAEDLVRECVSRFPQALFVESRCFESIHVHDAVASWSAKPGWTPAL